MWYKDREHERFLVPITVWIGKRNHGIGIFYLLRKFSRDLSLLSHGYFHSNYDNVEILCVSM